MRMKQVLNDRQLRRAKFSIGAALSLMTLQFVVVQGAQTYFYADKSWTINEIETYKRGFVSAYANTEEICDSWVLGPGIPLYHPIALFFLYLAILIELFLGISIISDIFMNAIERITSETRWIKALDENNQVVEKKVAVWNPTVANLTLMALGSSAPEILLSILETLQTLGATPGELGPSTIVGSAAFNLLAISAVSVYSVNAQNDGRDDAECEEDGTVRGVHKIKDLGVFTVTTSWSVIAYIWLYVCLLDGEVTVIEAILTFSFFWIMLIMAFTADRCNRAATKKAMDAKYGEEAQDAKIKSQLESQTSMTEGGAKRAAPSAEGIHQNFTAIETYNMLLKDELNEHSNLTDEQKMKMSKMRTFLQRNFGTDKVQDVDFDELKDKLDGPPLLNRVAYRRQTGFLQTTKRNAVAKGQIVRKEHAQASSLSSGKRNPFVCFPCLHYSVSEAAGYLLVNIESRAPGKFTCTAKTIDGEAKAPDDYDTTELTHTFTEAGQVTQIKVPIKDDEEWEPDKDFYIQLYNEAGEKLEGEDTKCRITILDDDRPGCLAFECTNIKHPQNEKSCKVRVQRLHAFDGHVTVKYKTIQIDESSNTATPGIDYIEKSGTLVFGNGEASQTIDIEIIKREMEDDEIRDEIFGVQLFEAEPVAVKISKKDVCIVEIVNDAEAKKKAEALQQLLQRINNENQVAWGQQFVNACMLHPTRTDTGEIKDVSAGDALIHFFSIGWKCLFAIVPPPHLLGGWACFIVSLICIGIITAVVGEVAGLMGCVVGLKPGVTAITFVAIGTSLPDTFASKKAAIDDRYADSAVGNITGSNSVNVFLGLGLPWCIAVYYYQNLPTPTNYTVPAKGLDLSVALFLGCSIIAVIILVVRRCTVGGELGGGKVCRTLSAALLFLLWVIYVTVSSLAQYQIIKI